MIDLLRRYSAHRRGRIVKLLAAWADAAGVSQTMLTGTGPVTTDHAEAILSPDYEGVYREFDVDEPVWKGGRVVTNELKYSEDFSNAAWAKVATATVTGTNVLNFPAVNDGTYQIMTPDLVAGDVLVGSIVLSGSGTVSIRVRRDGAGTLEETVLQVTLTSTPTKYTVSHVFAYTQTASRLQVYRASGNTAVLVTATDAQVEHSTGRSDTTTPSEYIATTTAPVQKVFAYANGNTVASNVVTEARGADLADAPYLVSQPAGTNSQIQSNDQTNAEYTATNVTVAQDETGLTGAANTACTLTATAANGTVIANAIVAASGEHAAKWYIKRKTGTGDIDLTLDNGTGWTTVTLTSDFDLFAIDQAALTNPQIGIRIVTDTDAVIVGNAECHLTSTVEEVKSLGPIFTTAAEATTAAFVNSYPADNHSNTEGPLYLEFENTGDDVDILSAGSDVFLKITSGQLILDDGTTQISTACAAGEHKVGIIFGDDGA